MDKINWKNIQENSDQILSDGLFKLRSLPFQSIGVISKDGFGNYLISREQKPYYIGEAKTLSKRLKQQLRPASSTFYKNWLKQNPSIEPLAIDSFEIQSMRTEIGRKEIEESGIVNLPTTLNRFQLGKRNRCTIADHNGLWDEVQNHGSRLLEKAAQAIVKTRFKPWFENVVLPNAGVYMVKDKTDDIIYIGETSNLNERFNTHSERTYFSALRRHVGTSLLGFTLQKIDGKKRYFSDKENVQVTEFLRSCIATFSPTAFGRYELEEYLIKEYRPRLNIK